MILFLLAGAMTLAMLIATAIGLYAETATPSPRHIQF